MRNSAFCRTSGSYRQRNTIQFSMSIIHVQSLCKYSNIPNRIRGRQYQQYSRESFNHRLSRKQQFPVAFAYHLQRLPPKKTDCEKYVGEMRWIEAFSRGNETMEDHHMCVYAIFISTSIFFIVIYLSRQIKCNQSSVGADTMPHIYYAFTSFHSSCQFRPCPWDSLLNLHFE